MFNKASHLPVCTRAKKKRKNKRSSTHKGKKKKRGQGELIGHRCLFRTIVVLTLDVLIALLFTCLLMVMGVLVTFPGLCAQENHPRKAQMQKASWDKLATLEQPCLLVLCMTALHV